MTRRRHSFRSRLTRESESLTRLAIGLSQSGSRVEDAYWEHRLAVLITRMLDAGADQPLLSAMDHLYRSNPRAYDELADMTEASAESGYLAIGGVQYQKLILALPVLAWSRFAIPSGRVPAAVLDAVRVHLSSHVLGRDAMVALADYLFSPDQMPTSYVETFELSERFGKALEAGTTLSVDVSAYPETGSFISDIRYFLAAVAVPAGGAVFRWQEDENVREEALGQWEAQGGNAMKPLFSGCAYELLAPSAFYAAWRDADRRARPFSVRSAVAFLVTVFDLDPKTLRAVTAPFYDDMGIAEYRVGFLRSDAPELIHGVVWPLIGMEDEEADSATEIEAVLRDAGVGEVTVLEDRMPVEYCDDCGAPLFPNLEGEAVHAGISGHDEEAQEPMHLH